MGRITKQPPAAAPAVAPPLTHFTHPHELHPLLNYSPNSVCSGCRQKSSGVMYACSPCAFMLHESCATTFPSRIKHPSHVGCTLSLLSAANYSTGAFRCNACGCRGDGWNFHCTRCKYDLHVSCLSRPTSIRHKAHASCLLHLTFADPYPGGFSCDVCRGIGVRQWVYRCHSCEFDAHLDCVAAPGPLQHSHSMPAHTPAPLYQHQLMHSASTGAIGMNPNPGYGYGSGAVPAQSNGPAAGSWLGGKLITTVVLGLVGGAFQGVGQGIVQGFGGDSGGGGAADGGGGSVF